MEEILHHLGWLKPYILESDTPWGNECSLNMINKHTVNTEAFCTWRVWNPIKTQVFIMFLSCTQKNNNNQNKNKPLEAPKVTFPSSFLLRVYDVLLYIYISLCTPTPSYIFTTVASANDSMSIYNEGWDDTKSTSSWRNNYITLIASSNIISPSPQLHQPPIDITVYSIPKCTSDPFLWQVVQEFCSIMFSQLQVIACSSLQAS